MLSPETYLRWVLDLTSVFSCRASTHQRVAGWCHRYYAGESEQDNKKTREQDLQFFPNTHRRRGGLLYVDKKCTCEAWNGCPRSIRASSGSSATPVRGPGFDVQPPGPDYAACL